MARLLLLGHDLGDGDEDLDREQADAILVVLHQVLKHGYHLLDHDGGGHLLDELGHVGGGLAAHHGCVVVDQLAELLAQLFLDGRRDLGVGRRVEAASRHLGGEPVGLGEADGERDEVLLDLLGGEVAADLVERLDSLRTRWRVSAQPTRRMHVSITITNTSAVTPHRTRPPRQVRAQLSSPVPCLARRALLWPRGSPEGRGGRGPTGGRRRSR